MSSAQTGLSGNAAEAACRRGDLLERRSKVMAAWADFMNESWAGAVAIPSKTAAFASGGRGAISSASGQKRNFALPNSKPDHATDIVLLVSRLAIH